MQRSIVQRSPASLAYGIVLLVLVAALAPSCGAPGDRATPQPAEPAAVASASTCAEHGAPTALCFLCDASLREPGRLWCREHDRYEDRCWECHPELRDATRPWCAEHSLYEDECFLCHPELLAADATLVPADDVGLICAEHRLPEQECGICHPELLAQAATGPGVKVRLPSADSAGRAGVRVMTPEVLALGDGVVSFAELDFNQNRLAQITSLVGGIVQRVEVDLGSRVGRGQLLATISSAAIGEAQGDYLRALAEDDLRRVALAREHALRADEISSERDYQEALAARQASVAGVRQARQRLEALGFDEPQVEALVRQQSTPGVLELRAPFDGEVVERAAVQGAAIDVADVLFTIADTSVLWAMANVPESQLSRVRKGQDVELTVDSIPGRAFSGTLTWIAAMVDKRTRMARARVEVANDEGLLRAHMFARARIATARSDRALTVPLDAVQTVTGIPIVFVRSSDDLFEARPVTLGAKRDGRVAIVAGLGPAEPVVVAGGFALKSRLLSSRLGAGCVDD